MKKDGEETVGKYNRVIEHRLEITSRRGCDRVRHKLVSAATEDGLKLEFSVLRRRGIVLSV